jgi:hypothetical protein
VSVDELRWHPETGAPMRAEREAQYRMTLVEALRGSVPMWMAHWWRWPPAIREARGQVCGQVVGTFGDQIQWPSKAHAPRMLGDEGDVVWAPGTGEAFNRLAEGLAIAAYQPGGVTAFGMHWEMPPTGPGRCDIAGKVIHPDVTPGRSER